jgi:GNAT superfamily N-acetyltransferase
MLEDFSGQTVIQAMEENLRDTGIRWANLLQAEVHEEPEITWFVSGLPFELCNGIVDARLVSEDSHGKIDEILKQLATYHVPMACMVTPSMQAAGIEQNLLAHGWQFDDEAPGMAADLHKLNEHLSFASDLSIKEVVDGDMLKEWMRVMAAGSGMPDSAYELLLDVYARHGFAHGSSARFYLALLHEEPVATSLLFLSGGVAGIYNVATLPHARRQGIGAAVTLAALLEARATGYRIGVLQSSQMGLHVYRNLGFHEYCTFRLYFRADSSSRTEWKSDI